MKLHSIQFYQWSQWFQFCNFYLLFFHLFAFWQLFSFSVFNSFRFNKNNNFHLWRTGGLICTSNRLINQNYTHTPNAHWDLFFFSPALSSKSIDWTQSIFRIQYELHEWNRPERPQQFPAPPKISFEKSNLALVDNNIRKIILEKQPTELFTKQTPNEIQKQHLQFAEYNNSHSFPNPKSDGIACVKRYKLWLDFCCFCVCACFWILR